MTDYYEKLRHAMLRRPEIGAEERRSIYSAAREALIGTLRQIDPPPNETLIASERKEFEKAVFRLECEFASPALRNGKANGADHGQPTASSLISTSSSSARVAKSEGADCATTSASSLTFSTRGAKSGAANGATAPALTTNSSPRSVKARGADRAPPPAFVWPPVRPETPPAPAAASVSPPPAAPSDEARGPTPASPPAAAKGTLMSRLDEMNKILRKLQSDSPGVEASALISEDGLMMASALSGNVDETRVGGMTATLLNLGTRASAELGRGAVKEIIIRGDNGYAVVIDAGRGVLLLTLANESAKLGLIFFDMNEAVRALKKVL
jgi:predicted regulator of Ras-like GTPase activity (Roadblock/LC7/MglB family)